jgi:hypothetical protein
MRVSPSGAGERRIIRETWWCVHLGSTGWCPGSSRSVPREGGTPRRPSKVDGTQADPGLPSVRRTSLNGVRRDERSSVPAVVRAARSGCVSMESPRKVVDRFRSMKSPWRSARCRPPAPSRRRQPGPPEGARSWTIGSAPPRPVEELARRRRSFWIHPAQGARCCRKWSRCASLSPWADRVYRMQPSDPRPFAKPRFRAQNLVVKHPQRRGCAAGRKG